MFLVELTAYGQTHSSSQVVFDGIILLYDYVSNISTLTDTSSYTVTLDEEACGNIKKNIGNVRIQDLTVSEYQAKTILFYIKDGNTKRIMAGYSQNSALVQKNGDPLNLFLSFDFSAFTNGFLFSSIQAGFSTASHNTDGLVHIEDPDISSDDSYSVYSKQQVDSLLSSKANSADLSNVATSGSYTDLSDKPTLDDISDGSTRKLSNYVPTSRTINSKALSNNITLNLDDVGDGTTRKLANYVPTTRTVNSKALSSNITLNLDDVSDGSSRKLSNYELKSNLKEGAYVDVDETTMTSSSTNLPTSKSVASYISSLNYITAASIPTNVSEFTNDAGYLTSETDPTVPSWAKQNSKPSYTLDEVSDGSTRKLSNYVPTTRKVNNQALSADITLNLDNIADGSSRKLANYVPYSEIISTINGFDQRKLWQYEIHNTLWSAEKRYDVTLTGFSSGGAANLFDGSFETSAIVSAGGTGVITIAGKNNSKMFGGGYPYGYIEVAFYYTNIPQSVTCRVYSDWEQNPGWHEVTLTNVVKSANYGLYRGLNTSFYGVTKIEITVNAKSGSTANVTEVAFYQTRGTLQQMSMFNKTVAQTLYHNLTAPGFVVTGGTSSQFLKANGTLDSNSYALSSSVPTSTSDLTNDSGYITSSDIPTNVSAFTNDAGYLTSHQSLADLVASAQYNSTSKKIEFYNKSGTKLNTDIDATAFIKDGMVDNVEIVNGKLVISFNTDAGKENIEIPISSIFNANNYYTKTEIDGFGFITSSDIPTNISSFTNDAGYLTSETDPTVPSWAKQTNKPSYTLDEVTDGSTRKLSNYVPTSRTINSKALSNNITLNLDDVGDGTSRKLSNYELKTNLKEGAYVDVDETSMTSSSTNLPTSKAVASYISGLNYITSASIPTNVSAFTNDAGYLTSFTETDPTVPSWAKQTNKPSYTLDEVTDGSTRKLSNYELKSNLKEGAYVNVDETTMTSSSTNLPTSKAVASYISGLGYATTSQIPTVNNSTITIQKNGSNVDSFTTNAASGKSINITVPTKTSDLTNDSGFLTQHQDISGKQDVLTAGEGISLTNNIVKTTGIPFGICDSSSTANAFTATVPGIYKLEDGVCCLLKNGVVTSAKPSFTININNLGAKPVYSNMAESTVETTLFNIAYTMLFVYDSTRVEGGCWILYRGYDSNTNTIGYQLRTNSTVMTVSDRARYYKIYFTSANNTQWVPASSDWSSSATALKVVNQRPINPFGRIVYTSASTNYTAGSDLAASTIWDQYIITLGYSFNRTGAALTLTLKAPVYVKCAPQADGSAIIDATTPFVQELPSAGDGNIYIFLGIAVSATTIELFSGHPVYYNNGSGIRLWDGNSFATVATTGSYNDLSNKPAIPTVNNKTVTIKKNSSDTGDSFTLNQSTDKSINLGLGGAADKSVDTSISNSSTSTNLPTSKAVSDFVDAKGYLTSYTETDPTVPSWAKESSKPSYTLDEVSDGSTRKLSNYVPTSRTINSKALSSNVTLTLDDVADGTSRKIPTKISELSPNNIDADLVSDHGAFDLGSDDYSWRTLYINSIGTTTNKCGQIYAWDIGSSSYPVTRLYATDIYGSLTGNATTATTAEGLFKTVTDDSSGETVTTTHSVSLDATDTVKKWVFSNPIKVGSFYLGSYNHRIVNSQDSLHTYIYNVSGSTDKYLDIFQKSYRVAFTFYDHTTTPASSECPLSLHSDLLATGGTAGHLNPSRVEVGVQKVYLRQNPEISFYETGNWSTGDSSTPVSQVKVKSRVETIDDTDVTVYDLNTYIYNRSGNNKAKPRYNIYCDSNTRRVAYFDKNGLYIGAYYDGSSYTGIHPTQGDSQPLGSSTCKWGMLYVQFIGNSSSPVTSIYGRLNSLYGTEAGSIFFFKLIITNNKSSSITVPRGVSLTNTTYFGSRLLSIVSYEEKVDESSSSYGTDTFTGTFYTLLRFTVAANASLATVYVPCLRYS